MPRNDSLVMGELTDISYYILLSLVEAKHGYLLMKTIQKMTNNTLSIGPASMYTTIKKLLSAELIMELENEEDKKRKTYVTTKKGIQLLEKEVQRRREMVRHAEEIFKQKRGALT